jgi:hypothetical protein
MVPILSWHAVDKAPPSMGGAFGVVVRMPLTREVPHGVLRAMLSGASGFGARVAAITASPPMDAPYHAGRPWRGLSTTPISLQANMR